MSITPKNKSSKTVSERERFIGFVYVLTLFIVITGACGFILFTTCSFRFTIIDLLLYSLTV